MGTYPTKIADFANWAEAHTSLWATAPTAIGLTAAQALAFKTATETLRAKLTEQSKAKTAAKSATEEANDAFRDARALTSDLVRTIRAFALNSANPVTVYTAAGIPAPNPNEPVAPPGQPKDFTFILIPGGGLLIKWKAKHPEGSDRVVYFVQRKVLGASTYNIIGGTGDREFLDDTLPIGVDGVTYIVTAQRGQVQGPASVEQTVTIGTGGGGGRLVGRVVPNKFSAKLGNKAAA